jgi:hypothetical protein
MSNHLGDTNKMVSDTPRTDEAQFGTGRVSVSFARTLERELNAANDRIKRLEEGGDKAILNSYLPDRLAVWTKAKEAKL